MRKRELQRSIVHVLEVAFGRQTTEHSAVQKGQTVDGVK